jgi:hypothetical protein
MCLPWYAQTTTRGSPARKQSNSVPSLPSPVFLHRMKQLQWMLLLRIVFAPFRKIFLPFQTILFHVSRFFQ